MVTRLNGAANLSSQPVLHNNLGLWPDSVQNLKKKNLGLPGKKVRIHFDHPSYVHVIITDLKSVF